MVRTIDGWCAITLARPTDLALVPAFLELVGGEAVSLQNADFAAEVSEARDAMWDVIERVLTGVKAEDVVRAAALLGLAASRLDEVGVASRSAVRISDVVHHSSLDVPMNAAGLVVVNLASLWAGPLCAHLLARAGATVIAVEGDGRPDGARVGDPDLFARLHADTYAVSVDFTAKDGKARLAALLADADIVIEGSRPRALEAIACDPISIAELKASNDDRHVTHWVSITAYGRGIDSRDRIGFGDDAAVAGGLVRHEADGSPSFLGDAIADPLTGMVAALIAAQGRNSLADISGVCLHDVALAHVAAAFAPDAAVLDDVLDRDFYIQRAIDRSPVCGEHNHWRLWRDDAHEGGVARWEPIASATH